MEKLDIVKCRALMKGTMLLFYKPSFFLILLLSPRNKLTTVCVCVCVCVCAALLVHVVGVSDPHTLAVSVCMYNVLAPVGNRLVRRRKSKQFVSN